jgi:hypothetical protein
MVLDSGKVLFFPFDIDEPIDESSPRATVRLRKAQAILPLVPIGDF